MNNNTVYVIQWEATVRLKSHLKAKNVYPKNDQCHFYFAVKIAHLITCSLFPNTAGCVWTEPLVEQISDLLIFLGNINKIL